MVGIDVSPVASASRRAVDGTVWERVVVQTPWICAGDDLAAVMRRHLRPLLRPGDVAIVSEKAAAIATGRTVPLASVSVGRLAGWLSLCVRPVGDSRGLSVPEKDAVHPPVVQGARPGSSPR
jgi:hypothetical protein